MTKEVIIVSLIILIVYLYYQQNNQTNSAFLTSENKEQITKLQQEIKHYQSLYQKRVAKDLETDQSQKIKELTENLTQTLQEKEELEKSWKEKEEEINQQLEEKTENEKNNLKKLELYQQKINEQDTALFNLAKSKIKGKKDAEKLLTELETKWSKKEIYWEQEKEGLSKKIKELEEAGNKEWERLKRELEKLKKDNQQKERTIISLNNSYEKLSNQKKTIEQELKKVVEKQKQELEEANKTEQKKIKIEQEKIEELQKATVMKDKKIQQLEEEFKQREVEIVEWKNIQQEKLDNMKERIRLTEARVFTEEYDKQPPHLRLLEHRKTFQEWLDGKYPNSGDKKFVTMVSSYRINAERRGWRIEWNLKGGRLDLTKYKNLESIILENYEMATPLTELDITGCEKIRRIWLYDNYFSPKLDIIKTHLSREELEKIMWRTADDIEKRQQH